MIPLKDKHEVLLALAGVITSLRHLESFGAHIDVNQSVRAVAIQQWLNRRYPRNDNRNAVDGLLEFGERLINEYESKEGVIIQ